MIYQNCHKLIQRLVMAVLMVSVEVQGCNSLEYKDATGEINADKLVPIDITYYGDEIPYTGIEIFAKRGFINTKGKIVIPPRFHFFPELDDMYSFWGRNFSIFTDNGLAVVRENGKFGYINAKGEMVIPAIFQIAEGFAANGLAAVQKNEKDKLFGYINAKGEMVIPAKFEWATSFDHTGVALVKDKKGVGFINAHGDIVARLEGDWLGYQLGGQNWYEAVRFADNGLAPVRSAVPRLKDWKWGYINKEIKMVIPASFFQANDFAPNGLAAVQEAWAHEELADVGLGLSGGTWSYINAKGEIAIPVKFQQANNFSANGLAAVCIGIRKCGYINSDGEMVIPARFESASDFSAIGLAAVMVENKRWGYINAKGEMVIPARYDWAEIFSSNGVARVQENGKTVYINEKGEILVYIDEIEGRKVIKNAKDEVIWADR